MKLSEAIEEFLIACEADGLSLSTIRWYISLLKNFSVWVGDSSLSTIDTNSIRSFIIYIRKKYKPDTASGHVRALHRFFKWSADEYDIKNPMRNVRYPQVQKQHVPKSVSNDDIVKLFDSIAHDVVGHRDRAMFALLIDCGLRAGEVITIQMTNLDMERRRVVVTGKGNKSRVVPFSEFTKRVINKWLLVRGPYEYLFYNMRTTEPLTSNGLLQITRRIKKKAGITGRLNPHAFRHAFARDFLKNGGDLVSLRRLLGHADLEVTANFYAVFTVDEIGETHDKFSPIKNLSLDKGLSEE
jgi:site-specific recombinase XerD